MKRLRRFTSLLLAVGLLLTATMVLPVPTKKASATVPKHYTSNLTGQFSTAAGLGYNLMDVSSKAVMDALPTGTQGLYWIGNFSNTTCAFALSDSQVTTIVNNNKNDPKFSNIYFIADEPHTSSCSGAPTTVANRTALVHSLDSNAKTMVTVQDGDNHPGEYQAFADSADYIAVDPYPCNINNATTGCNYTMMTSRINSALTYIPASRMIPVFQTFGQACATSNFYRLPTVTELQNMLAIWDQKVPSTVRAFDWSYGWGHQGPACPTLADANGTNGYPDLQTVMSNYFAGQQPITINLGVSADTKVESENPDDNYGASTTYCASDDTYEASRGLMKFTVSGVSGRIVTSALLTLHVYNGSQDTIDVKKVTDQSWVESTVTWNNQPSNDSGNITTIPATTSGSDITVDLGGLITADGTYTIKLIGHTTDSFCVNTKESAYPPALVVTAQY